MTIPNKRKQMAFVFLIKSHIMGQNTKWWNTSKGVVMALVKIRTLSSP